MPKRARAHRRSAAWPWAVAGTLAGAVVAVLTQAPATWLAQALARASEQRLLLADARGTLWSGSAQLVLSGGPGSRDARALPGRLHWTLARAPGHWRTVELALRQACCINDTLRVQVEPGIGRLRLRLRLPAPPGTPVVLGRWPAAWLAGLGAPFNTLRLQGQAVLSSQDLQAESVQGRWQLQGQAALELHALSSALSALTPLGSYRLALSGDGPGPSGARLSLQTLQGPLRLSGAGEWAGPKLRFRGQAQADPGSEAMLNNLLNLLGQRQGALALLAIG